MIWFQVLEITLSLSMSITEWISKKKISAIWGQGVFQTEISVYMMNSADLRSAKACYFGNSLYYSKRTFFTIQ